MAEPSTERTSRHAFEKVRSHVQVIRGWAEQTLLWRVWDRMLETEFIDRSIALAGKAFISFFPLIIVIAAFVPAHLRMSIFTTLTHRLGITGASLATVKQAFASAADIRRATGLLGLVLAVFYASSFTTALRRAYLAGLEHGPREGGQQLRPGSRLGGGIPRLHGAAGWHAQRPGERRGDSRICRGGAGLVHCHLVVHRLADAQGAGTASGSIPQWPDHGDCPFRLCAVVDAVDAEQCDEQQSPIRHLRGGARPGRLVFRRRRHRRRRLRGTGPRPRTRGRSGAWSAALRHLPSSRVPCPRCLPRCDRSVSPMRSPPAMTTSLKSPNDLLNPPR